MKKLKVIIIVYAALLIFLILGGLVVYGLDRFFSDFCGNTLISETFSPDKKLKVVVFRRDCGATTGYVTHVSVVNGWDKLANDWVGNIYVLEDLIPLDVKWKGNGNVHVARSVSSKTFMKKNSHLVLPKFQKVDVTYETVGAE